MHPILFKIGPVPIYSFGLMMAVGFIAASLILSRELVRKGYHKDLGSTITLLAIVFGLAGSKILFLAENLDDFLRHPAMAVSPGGLTWYGGFFLAIVAIVVYTRRQKVPFLAVADAASPAMLLGYGIARIGCHLSGDGDYGLPTDLPWGAQYSGGTYPPSLAFREFPELVQKYGVNGIVPDTIRVHPTPVYEMLAGLLLFAIVWRLRTKLTVNGQMFALYLMLSGAARFLVEFIRLNPRLFLGLSEAQLIAVILIACGAAGFVVLGRMHRAGLSR
ncbi:MAG TPA: prolipoprotein diacylglyceryl transferase [Bacteroidota bacterium]|nr:prolipoprotein diacylglyceryl transferase [Bacteroidota bacterium]